MLKKIMLLMFFGVFSFLLVFEFFIYFTDIDAKSLKPILYYHNGDLPAYGPVENARRIFGLVPNSELTSIESMHPKEKKYTEKTIRINSLGFRDKERSAEKPEGVYRIIILGESNTFGPSVNNGDTYPAVLERLLNEKYPSKFEVWNAGISTYTMSQKVAYAEEIIEKYDPDLLIFQDNNSERRAFLLNYDYREYFKKNKELYRENIPLLIFPRRKETAEPESSNEIIHYFLVDHSRVYRFLMISINNIIANKHFKLYNELQFDKKDKLYSQFYFYGMRRNYRDFKKFAVSHPNNKIVLLDANVGSSLMPTFLKEKEKYDNLDYFSLDNHNKTEEYKYCHPPSYVYEWYAHQIMEIFNKKDYFQSL
jgi:hypothetical protein